MQKEYFLRAKYVYILILLSFLILIIRLVYLQVINKDLSRYAQDQQASLEKLKPRRGSIFDRHGVPLAMSRSIYTLKAVPSQIKNHQTLAKYLHTMIGLKEGEILKRLKNKTKKAVYLKRRLSDDLYQKLMQKKILGLYFDREQKRYYPKGRLAVHVLGFVGDDDIGLEGLESLYHDSLTGDLGFRAFVKDGRKRELLAIKRKTIIPRDGDNLILTLDERIQYITEREMDKIYEDCRPRGITIIVIKPQTGEILALANRPNYNPNEALKSTGQMRRNRAITDVYEPGSTFKIVTFSGALNENIITVEQKIFCEKGSYRVKGRRKPLHDHRPHGWMSVREVLQKSSNIGTVKIAQKLGNKRLFSYIKAFGFGSLTGVALPGEVSGFLRDLPDWSDASMSAIPMGQEIGTTPLQMTMAMAAVANNGVLMMPLIVKELHKKDGSIVVRYEPEIIRRVMEEDTAMTLVEILEGVASPRGTARRASIPGVRVAGKTGTAQKFDLKTKRYSKKKYMASFIGFFPVEKPQYCIGVFVDEPPYSQRYGGTIAAPIFRKIGQELLGE